MEWFNPTFGIEYVHPSSIREGMRIATEVHKPLPGGGHQRKTALAPVWNIGTGQSTGYGIRYLFRLNTGELYAADSNCRVPVILRIDQKDMPPHTGLWITNQRFDENAGMLGDRYFYERTRQVDKFETEDGRVYRLLFGQSRRREDLGRSEQWRCFWVYRWDQGVKWLGPGREAQDLAWEQFEAIREGKAW